MERNFIYFNIVHIVNYYEIQFSFHKLIQFTVIAKADQGELHGQYPFGSLGIFKASVAIFEPRQSIIKIILLKLMKIQVWTLFLPMLWLLVSADSSLGPSCCGQNQIQVVGEATVFVPPDLAIVNIYFQLASPTQAEGMKKLSTAMNKLVSLLKEKNYAGSTYETLYVVIVDEYEGKPENLRVVGKQVYQAISVFLPITDDRGKKIGALADSIRKIQGLHVDFVTFDFKDKEKTELKAKQAAFKVAHQTAEDYCSIIDRKLGNILSIDDTYLELQSPLEVSQSGQVIDETSPSNLETSIMLSYSNAQYGIKYFTKVTYELK